MEDKYFKNLLNVLILGTLVILSYILLKPLFISIILGIILASMFLPVYKWINKILKSEDISAFLVCVLILILIIIPVWYLTPVILNQSTKILIQAQNIDFGELFKEISYSLFKVEGLSNELLSMSGSFANKLTSYMVKSVSNFILNIPLMFLHVVVFLFTFFFVLRDNKLLISYIKSLIPFSREMQDKLFKSSREITLSVIYGRIALGIAQGLLVGVGFFVFKLPNALLLTSLAALAGILPIIGTVVIWLPVSIILFLSGEKVVALGIIGFGILATIFESIIQPILLARMVKINSSIMLVGMIGGLFLFGILGVIIGPLILAYLLIVLELYRDKRVFGPLITRK